MIVIFLVAGAVCFTLFGWTLRGSINGRARDPETIDFTRKRVGA